MFGKGLPLGMHQPQLRPSYPAPHGRERARRRMTPFYVAGVCLVAAQLLGIYALVTRKADFTFALIMMSLVVVALASGADGIYRQLH
jgi:hypothetical protein